MKYLGIAFCVLIFLFLAGCLLAGLVKMNSAGDDHTTDDTEDDDTDFPPCAEPTSQHVTVVGQSCSARMVGMKKPKAVNEFLIYFKDEDSKTFPVAVPEDLYDGFEEGQTGTLTLVDGKLYGFELD
ncbi:MAG: hypothetical protein IKV44_04870 [Clostridia bacterium]|nr:hypothetical protein [Clostridia bacterium]